MAIRSVDAKLFTEIVSGGQSPVIVDVRTDLECRTEKLDCHFIHIPLHELDAASFMRAHGKEVAHKTLYILCRSGGRARKAAEILAAHVHDIAIVEGGLGACESCGTAIRRGTAISLERQVRIAAGALVLGGVLLGHFVSDYLYILSGMIGGGLIFSGVTDKCGLALLIAHAPWNQNDTQQEISKSLKKFEERNAS